MRLSGDRASKQEGGTVGVSNPLALYPDLNDEHGEVQILSDRPDMEGTTRDGRDLLGDIAPLAIISLSAVDKGLKPQ